MNPTDGTIWLCLLLSAVMAEVPHSPVRKPNSVSGVNATCTSDSLSVTVRMRQPFHGLLYARGFPIECRARGSGDHDVTLHLPASGCGVRVQAVEDGEMLNYVVTVEVQLDRHLQQAADQLRVVTCSLPAPSLQLPRTSARTARKQVDRDHPRAWMELKKQVSVGEDTTMKINTWLSEGLDSHVADCSAHDGAGESSQRLLDDRGCPLDEFILPALIQHDNQKAVSSSSLRLQVAETTFAAFKFPDRTSLHLRCTLQICRGRCAQPDCSRTGTNLTRASRDVKGEVLNRLEVFNSVEVLAPGIELDDLESLLGPYEPQEPVQVVPSPTDRAFCLSPPKMALAFGVLGLVFLCAVAVALYTLMRGRRHHYRSKRLLGEETLVVQDSPILWPHVRVMH